MKISIQYILPFFFIVGFMGCKEDEGVTTPSKPTFTMTPSGETVLTGDTVRFTVPDIGADQVWILPMGKEYTDPESGDTFAGFNAVEVTFEDGVGSAEFIYPVIGDFEVYAVAHNYLYDLEGPHVRTTYSDAQNITVSSGKSAMLSFALLDDEDNEYEATIDEGTKTITVELPYDPFNALGVTALVADFTSSRYSGVLVGSTDQEAGTTVNDFSSPIDYTVEAYNGTTTSYTVTVSVAPVETSNTITAVSASVDGEAMMVVLDEATQTATIVLPGSYDASVLDSLIDISITTDGDFDLLHYAADGTFDGDEVAFEDDILLDLTSSQTIRVTAQDGTEKFYTFQAEIPTLELTISSVPVVSKSTNGYDIVIKVVTGTDMGSVITNSVTSGAVISDIEVSEDGENYVPFTSGDAVDYSSGEVFFKLIVDSDKDYEVEYTVTIATE